MDSFDFEELKVNGIKVNYYAVCRRKLWLFSHFVRMEHDWEMVERGRLLHESSYEHLPRKEVLLDDLVRIDIVEGGKVLEVKHSRKMRMAARLQLLYYLYYLKEKGIDMVGELRFPRERRVERVVLGEEDGRMIEEVLREISVIESLPKPPKANFSPICRKCSYGEFCWGI